MLATIIRIAGICGLCTLVSALPLAAQTARGPLAGKMTRSQSSVDTRLLNPVRIEGAKQGTGSAAHRAAPGNALQKLSGQKLTTLVKKNPSDTLLLRGVEIKRSGRDGLPIFLREKAGGYSIASPNGRVDLQKASLAYLARVKNLLQVKQPEAEFTIQQTQRDALRQTHVRLKQTFRGVEVYGGELMLHLQDNAVQTLNGRHFPTPQLTDVEATVSADRAFATATKDVKERTAYRNLTPAQQQLLGYDKPLARLVIYHPNQDNQAERLTWHITLRPNVVEVWNYFVDAKTGQVMHRYNHTCSADGPRTASAKDLKGGAQPMQTYQVGNAYYLIDGSRPMFSAAKSKLPDSPVGALWTVDARRSYGKNFGAYQVTSTNNAWNDPVAVSAHVNGGKAFEYFKNVHGRNSLDGNGGTVIAIINVMDEKGKELDNAFWNGKFMAYGNGNKYFKPFAAGLDVAGHEMSHGVIENSANLQYQGQSGAINESFADIFGVMIDAEDWNLGEDIVKPEYYPSGAMRNLADPHNGGSSLGDLGYQPRVMAEFYTGTQDNGGVHVNSGICNWAFYKFATEVSKPKAEKVYYRALTTYLTSRAQFVDLRLAVVQAATDLHGATSAEVAAAKRAFDAVGILETGGDDTEEPEDLPTNPGQEYILCHDASAEDSDPNTWYVTGSNGSGLTPRSRVAGRGRPSVTDRGDAAYYVGADHRIKAITLSGTAQDRVVQNQPIWNNVAVSKDGKRLAAVSTAADTSVYVYDFDKKSWAKFVLYNPTYSEDVKSGDVRFADAIEWDYSGEYLLYDAYNVINNPAGTPIEYWDVGLIQVWDNQQNTFGSGTIDKIFTSLPQNVSIGNPAFSKRSSKIVAFDLVNAEDGTYGILGADLAKGTVAAIAENTLLGFPTFSKNDDQLAYTSLNEDGDTVVNVIRLKEDRINPEGEASTILREAKWAVWYVQGERKVLSGENSLTAFQFAGLNPPATGIIEGNNIQVAVPPDTDLKSLIAYFTHSSQSVVKVGNIPQISGVTPNDFINPVAYAVVAEDGTAKTYTVTVTKAVNTGIEDLRDISGEVSLYPNPSSGTFQVELDKPVTGPVYLQVFDSWGVLVYNHTLPGPPANGVIPLRLTEMPSGLYHLRLTTKELVARKKIVLR